MPDSADVLRANLAAIQERIAEAARRGGRTDRDITLVAVTKYVAPPLARLLAAAGCHDLGESRPQELWTKAAALDDLAASIRWHAIGHLQRNKLQRTLPLVSLVHAGDSLRLIAAIDRVAAEQQLPPVPLLLEVNISGYATKHGFALDELPALVEPLSALPHVRVVGLMAMAGREGDSAAARRDFAALRALRDRLRLRWGNTIALDELSMGMSGDFEEAIAEGATLVRIGSALFEGIA